MVIKVKNRRFAKRRKWVTSESKSLSVSLSLPAEKADLMHDTFK